MAVKAKHKTEALGVLLPGGGIKYATDHDRDTMKGVPTGTPIAMRPIGDRRKPEAPPQILEAAGVGLFVLGARLDVR